ncbi:hypothetical protein CDV55_102440 [Aspergillus turcosus]|nr:hypothetical protein CDV55_102440 [Aspergillus turcosus]
MDASSTRPPQPVTRLACNRCHQQKLRCRRSSIPGQPCARCENARVECIFEPPLRPGRPSTRRKSRSKSATPSKSVTASSATTPRQQEEPAVREPQRGYLSDLDGLFEVVASECSMACSNDDHVSLPPFAELSPDEALLSLGCRSPLNIGSLYMAPEWPHLPMQTHSSAPNPHSSSLPHGETFQPSASVSTTTSSSSSSWSSSSSSSISTSSLLAAADVNFYRLSELNMTLHEYSCQLAAATATARAGGQSDSVVDPHPSVTIDQILAVTQSLADILSSHNNNNTPNNNELHLNHKTLRSGPLADIDFPFHVPCRPSPDGATTLLILSCYLRLLHLYNTALSSPSAVVAPVSPTGNGNGNGIQPLRFQSCFSTPMTSSMALLPCVSSQLLCNIEAALQRLASIMPAASRGEQSWPWEPDAGPASSVMAIARAAMLEASTLQANLRQRLHLLNSGSSPE